MQFNQKKQKIMRILFLGLRSSAHTVTFLKFFYSSVTVAFNSIGIWIPCLLD